MLNNLSSLIYISSPYIYRNMVYVVKLKYSLNLKQVEEILLSTSILMFHFERKFLIKYWFTNYVHMTHTKHAIRISLSKQFLKRHAQLHYFFNIILKDVKEATSDVFS